MLPAWKLFMIQLQLPPPDVTPGGRVDPQMNKFVQVSSDDHQMLLAGGRSLGLMSGGILYHVTYLMVYLLLPYPHPHPPGQNDWRRGACENITFPYFLIV